MAACSQFFSLPELASHFLHEAPIDPLVNCQAVCVQWSVTIRRSEILQRRLRFEFDDGETSGPNEDSVALNPILGSHFSPLLRLEYSREDLLPGSLWQTERCAYAELSRLPWARDGRQRNAQARQAFARKEASWRHMQISHPPVMRVDWWHEWQSEMHKREEHLSHIPMLAGSGHEQLVHQTAITLGELWDLLEPRMLRGCSVQLFLFSAGISASADPTSNSEERRWDAQRGIDTGCFELPTRLRIRSQQIWPNRGPSVYQRFNIPSNEWKIYNELPCTPEDNREARSYRTRESNGVFWLVHDCKEDDGDNNWRWSRSEAFEYPITRVIASQYGGFRATRELPEI